MNECLQKNSDSLSAAEDVLMQINTSEEQDDKKKIEERIANLNKNLQEEELLNYSNHSSAMPIQQASNPADDTKEEELRCANKNHLSEETKIEKSTEEEFEKKLSFNEDLSVLGKKVFDDFFSKKNEKSPYVRNFFLQTVTELCNCGVKDIDYDAVLYFVKDHAKKDLIDMLDACEEPLIDLLTEQKLLKLLDALPEDVITNRRGASVLNKTIISNENHSAENESKDKGNKKKQEQLNKKIKGLDQKMLRRIL